MPRRILTQATELDLAAVSQLGVTKTGTAHTLSEDDVGQLILFTNGSAVTFTIPKDINAPNIPVGSQVYVMQTGTGKVSFAAASGVTLNAPGGLVGTSARWAEIWATKIDVNSWVVNGSVG